jgi:hypothetical protein
VLAFIAATAINLSSDQACQADRAAAKIPLTAGPAANAAHS